MSGDRRFSGLKRSGEISVDKSEQHDVGCKGGNVPLESEHRLIDSVSIYTEIENAVARAEHLGEVMTP